jgi:putative lipoprotein
MRRDKPRFLDGAATLAAALLLAGLGACARNEEVDAEEKAAREQMMEGIASVESAGGMVGEYTSSLKSASSPGREISLRLGLDGTAEIRTDQLNEQPPIVQTGRWEALAPDRARVTVGEDSLVLQRQGFSLIAEELDRTHWGTSDLAFLSVHAPAPKVSGRVLLADRLALGQTETVDVTLEDVSRADAPAEIVARQIIRGSGQVPILFELRYDPARIDPGHSYAVRARISEKGVVKFTTTEFYPVLTKGNPSQVQILLQSVKSP